jgi:hypothetical protein
MGRGEADKIRHKLTGARETLKESEGPKEKIPLRLPAGYYSNGCYINKMKVSGLTGLDIRE